MCKKGTVWISLFLSLTLAFNAYAGEIFRTESFSDASFGPVTDLRVSADRQIAVFVSSQVVGDNEHIYSMDVNSGVVRNLSVILTLDSGFAEDNEFFPVRYQISPDSQSIVFFAREAGSDDVGLYFSPLDGSAAPIRISAPQAEGTNVISAKFSNDSSKVAYLLRLNNTGFEGEVNVVSVNGPSLNLNLQGSNLLDFGFFSERAESLRMYKFSTDSTYLVYGDDQMLNSVELVDAATPNFLRGPIDLGFDVPNIENRRLFEISSLSDRVVFLQRVDLNPGIPESAQSDLFSIPIAGGDSIQLNDRQSDEENVLEFFVIEDPVKVVFRGFDTASGREEVFSADIDVAESEVTISNGVPANQQINQVVVPRLGSKAVFRSTFAFTGRGSLWAYDSETDSVTELTMVVESFILGLVPSESGLYSPGISSAVWLVAFRPFSGGEFNQFSVDPENVLPPSMLDSATGIQGQTWTWSGRPSEYAINYSGQSPDNYQNILFVDLLSGQRFSIPLPFGVTGSLFGRIPSGGYPSASGVIDNDTILFPYGDSDTYNVRFYISRRTEMDSDMCFPIAPPDKNPAVICL